MNIYNKLAALLLLASLGWRPVTSQAATTIDAANHYAYGANLGWLDARGDWTNGAVVGEYVCAGFIYSANVGWINVGSGSPANGIQYQNLSANDFGVNLDGSGNLRGFAYGANIGWINFEATGAPKVDLFSGKMSGYAYSANCGWISLTNAGAVVQTDFIQPAPLAPNGLPIPWLLANFGTTNVAAGADPDHDGQSNAQEYLAGTNPLDAADNLRITYYVRGVFPTAKTHNFLIWNSQPSRFYAIQSTTNLVTTPFTDIFSMQHAGANNVGFDTYPDQAFFRLRAFRPLMP